ncbi:MAG: branched-chain amino acid ABC transporter permease [Christensenellales bacterium]|nr:branched-chain amino acid ABC transporter permease [Christensenellales bacterium]
MKAKTFKSSSRNLITYAMVIAVFLLCELALSGAISGFKMSRSLRGQLVPICVYIVMAVSLNLTVGISGELSLGHAGFMSVGAFSGILASQWLLSAFPEANLELVRLLTALLVGGVMAAIAGTLIGIPVLRLRGDYLAIVTLAFGEIIRNLLNCVYFSFEGAQIHFSFLNPNLPGNIVINGPMGAIGVKKLATFEAGFLLVLFTLVVVLNLINSRSGRAIMAIRDNRIAAESVGINVTKYRMMAFVISAALAGMAGALYGLNYSTVQAAKFKFDTSILVLVFVVLGGIGNIRGSIIAATVLTILPEMLREFGNYRMLIYAIVLIAVMLVSNNPMLKSALSACKDKLLKTTAKEGDKA